MNLSQGLGSTLAGVFVSLVFYGVSILQTFLYYERYTKDTIILKSLVTWVFVLDTLHILLICVGAWQYLVLHFGDVTFLAYNHPPMLISVAVSSAVSCTVQSFFIYRIWLLMRSRFRWLFPAVLMPFVFAELVLGVCKCGIRLQQSAAHVAVYTIVSMFQTSLSAVSGPLLTTVAIAGNAASIAVDITITISLCALLAMTRTGFHPDTDRMLLRLIFITVNTGLSTTLFASLSVILLVTYPTDLIFTAVYFPLCTVYCNTMLASLNVRSFVRGGGEIRQIKPLSSFVVAEVRSQATAV